MNKIEKDKDATAHLRDVALRQLTWKPAISRSIAVAIVNTVLKSSECVFTDEVDLGFVGPTDANVIGSSWKRLADAGVISPTGHFRRSTKDASKGRKVFQYRLASLARAQTFLQRNGGTVEQLEQPDLFSRTSPECSTWSAKIPQPESDTYRFN